MDPTNRTILDAVVHTGRFPNMLLFGPPGTGKTTTIINLIRAYQETHYGRRNVEMVMHLNASDERGIDVVRTQISQFVHSRALFGEGLKFVVFDEVDYMTDTAQRILHHMMQEHLEAVRFCLICNYMSRIDVGLKTECVKFRFSHLPSDNVVAFLKTVRDAEQLQLSDATLHLIQRRYRSDMRSMLNFMQANNCLKDADVHVVEDDTWGQLMQTIHADGTGDGSVLREVCEKFNLSPRTALLCFAGYLVRLREIPIQPKEITALELAVSSDAPELMCLQFIADRAMAFWC
jgi:replication factor C subunit 3/5